MKKFLSNELSKIEKYQLSNLQKVGISILFSFLWLMLLVAITPSVKYTPLSFPFFGYLYSKLFNLVNA